VELFQLSLANFNWLSDKLREKLQRCCGTIPTWTWHDLCEHWTCIQNWKGDRQQSFWLLCKCRPQDFEEAFSWVCQFIYWFKSNDQLTASDMFYQRFLPLERNNQWDEIKQSFEICQGIPNIFGAIDGTHIPISIPANNKFKGYINRKNWASIALQCVVDGQGNFWNVCVILIESFVDDICMSHRADQ
jgi:hypothetical protein